MTIFFFQAAVAFISGFVVGANAIDCTVRLLKTVSGPSSTCEGFEATENGHYWPVGDTSGCHGWRATAIQEGAVHDNSANNIRCSDDRTKMLYDQYAASLNCTGAATSKEFTLNECQPGIPPSLYDMGLNYDCCNPDSPSCASSFTGTPRADSQATTDEEIYWNGELCELGTTSPSTSPGGGESSSTKRNSDRSLCFMSELLWLVTLGLALF